MSRLSRLSQGSRPLSMPKCRRSISINDASSRLQRHQRHGSIPAFSVFPSLIHEDFDSLIGQRPSYQPGAVLLPSFITVCTAWEKGFTGKLRPEENKHCLVQATSTGLQAQISGKTIGKNVDHMFERRHPELYTVRGAPCQARSEPLTHQNLSKSLPCVNVKHFTSSLTI